MIDQESVLNGLLPAGSGLEILLNLLLVSVPVILVAGLCDLLLRRRSAAARHQLWLLAIIAVLATPLLSHVMPDGTLGESAAAAPTWSFDAPVDERSSETTAAIQPEATAPMPPHSTGMSSHLVEDRGASARFTAGRLVRFEGIALAVWLSGVVVVSGFGMAGQYGLRRLRLASREVRDPELLHSSASACSRLGPGRDVVLLESDRATMPMTWGVWRPVLLLPTRAREWPEERLRMVLLHELMHVRRLDCLWQCVTLAAVAVHWFNPLIWLAAYRLRTERELACDDGVLSAGHVGSDYAELLLNLSTGGRRNVFAMCSGLSMTRSDRLKGRLQAIVDSGRDRAPLSRGSVAGSALALAIVLVPLSVTARMNVDVESVDTGAPEDSSVPPAGPQQQQQRLDAPVADESATTSGEVDVRQLVAMLLPDHRLRLDGQGKPVALVSADSEVLELPASGHVDPAGTGYWINTAMTHLSEAGPRLSGSAEATRLIQLLHALCHGPDFVPRKIYQPRAIDNGWLVEVGHDFEKYPGMIPFVHPYEILVDEDNHVTSLRQRSNTYLGSAQVYVDTITSVYEREVQVNGGINYPEVLEEELKRAWAREQGVPLSHNSTTYYPNAVTSVADEGTGERFYVESNGSRLFFLNSDGATVRIVDAVRATDLENLVGSPVVRNLELTDDVIRATVGKHTVVTVSRETGQIVSIESD